MSRLISYVLANRQSARKRVVIAVRFERDADIDLISVQDRDEQCVAIPCAAKTILILGGARALPTRPPANGLGEPPPRRLPHSSGRCSHYEPPDHLALCRSASSNVLDGYAAYKEAVCRVLVHKSAVGRGSAAIAICQAMRCDTGMPSRIIRLSAEQATRASVFWLGRVRARRPRPIMVLYRNTAVSPSERLPYTAPFCPPTRP